MAIPNEHALDVEHILARRHDNGWDLWATPDRKLGKGGPFSTLGAVRMLVEQNIPYMQAKAIRDAVGRELARRVRVTRTLVDARTALENATTAWRDAVRKAAEN